MNKDSLYTLCTLSLVSCSHAQHESALFTDVIDKKFTWPASVGFSDHMAHSYENTDTLDVDLIFSTVIVPGVAELFSNFRLQKS